MSKPPSEERQEFRRKAAERRRKPRPDVKDRRKTSDRRVREFLKGPLARTKGDAAVPTSPPKAKETPPPKAKEAPPPPKAKAAPRKPPAAGQIVLQNVVVRSLQAADPHRLAAELVSQKLAGSVQAAGQLLSRTPATVARYMVHQTADSLCAKLKATGADAFLQTSTVTCPHCGVAVPCEGEADAARRGVMFGCSICDGRVYLDSRDRKFHPVLKCSSCQSLLNLPAEPKSGKYRCKCGNILNFELFQLKMEFDAEPSDKEPEKSAESD